MGIADRKEREKLEMKRLIMDAAMRMFVEAGYEKTSIRAIAEKIEYSPATIYLYYRDKDDLLYDVQAQGFAQLLELFQQKATAKDPFKRLGQIARIYVDFGLEHPDIYDLMFIIRAPMNKVEEEGSKWLNGEACFAFVVTTLEACIVKKQIKFTDTMVAALSIWSMLHGIVSLNVRCRIKVSNLTEAEIPGVIDSSIESYLGMIKA
ncbi:TetR/AcrR family transcriptional regulator [uncultured Chitinophaga sp.]|jgi:Transcriptional regulator|uniref:TetR/AcrR family transcriptional regulator n=1 Tax=uncultured Chitinophaga sp. TaxID=339340 RepID=UPI0026049A97|nr:TetR/AcrR family transcriptional regulator [uncultured Chitinophaga sp.]